MGVVLIYGREVGICMMGFTNNDSGFGRDFVQFAGIEGYALGSLVGISIPGKCLLGILTGIWVVKPTKSGGEAAETWWNTKFTWIFWVQGDF